VYLVLINPYFYNRTDNVPVIYWLTNNYSQYIDVYYEFDLTVLDKNGNGISGASVVVEDKDGTKVVNTTTAAGGTITTQEIKAARYTHTAASGSGSGPSYTDTDDRGPFTLRISKAGYGSFYQYFTMTSAIDWSITLTHSPYSGKRTMGSAWR
jgi:hypothetical protein